MTAAVRLTRRGKGMVVGSAAALAAGSAAGSIVLTGAGVFTAAVVLLSVAWSLLRRAGTTVERTEVPVALRSGERFTVAAVVGVHRLGRGHGLIEGMLPAWAAADEPDASTVIALTAERTRLASRCCAHTRGVHAWPAVRLELPDPLGAAHGILHVPPTASTVVFPRLEPLGGAGIEATTGGAYDRDDDTAPASSGHGEPGAQPIPRPFQPGDGMRRIHWPATARIGEPMVRAEDGHLVRRAVVLLDCSPGGYLTDDGFERAVSAAASIAVHLLRLGWAVSVRLAGGGTPGSAVWSQGRRGESDVLTALAGVSVGDAGRPLRSGPRDPQEATVAVTGGGHQPAWCMPALLTIRAEAPAAPEERQRVAVWDEGQPLRSVWTTGTIGLVTP